VDDNGVTMWVSGKKLIKDSTETDPSERSASKKGAGGESGRGSLGSGSKGGKILKHRWLFTKKKKKKELKKLRQAVKAEKGVFRQARDGGRVA